MVMLCLVNIVAFISAVFAIFNIIKDEKERKIKNKWIYDEF